MKLSEVKGKNKRRNFIICYLWLNGEVTNDEIAKRCHISVTTVKRVIYKNRGGLKFDTNYEKINRIKWLKEQAKLAGDSKKDSADLIEQLRKEIEGDKPLIDNSKHYHFSASNLQSARERVLNGIN